MNNIYSKLFKTMCFMTVTAFYLMPVNTNYNISYAATSAPVKPTVKAVNKSAASVQTTYMSVSPVDVVKTPAKYLNKNITFNAEFISYTSLGLDYKPAFRDGSKYIGILIKREDVSDHVIPLSEMKIFVPREVAEKNIDLDSGDKIKLSGTVFSTALGDPWFDVKTFTVLTQKNKPKDKK